MVSLLININLLNLVALKFNEKIIIAHDFNLSIFLYRIPSDKFLKNYFNDKLIKFVDVNKLKKDLNKITIFWGNRLNKKILNELTN